MNNEYSANTVKLSFWFLEFKKTVSLMSEGFTLDDIKQKNAEENLFASSSPARSKLIMNTVSRRIQTLDPSFIRIFLKKSVGTQKLICLMTCMLSDSLFMDFVYEVVYKKLLDGTGYLTDVDVRIFFEDKRSQNKKISGWQDCTLKRLGVCYKTMLAEANIIDNSRTKRKITRPIVDLETETWMKSQGIMPLLSSLKGDSQ